MMDCLTPHTLLSLLGPYSSPREKNFHIHLKINLRAVLPTGSVIYRRIMMPYSLSISLLGIVVILYKLGSHLVKKFLFELSSPAVRTETYNLLTSAAISPAMHKPSPGLLSRALYLRHSPTNPPPQPQTRGGGQSNLSPVRRLGIPGRPQLDPHPGSGVISLEPMQGDVTGKTHTQTAMVNLLCY